MLCRILLLSLLFTGAMPLAAQSPSSSVFRSGIDLVALSVVVTDSAEQFVSGLNAADFIVFEDGIRQDVSFFAAGDLPIDLAVLLDTSSSMVHKLAIVQQAAAGFVSSLRPGDRITIVDIKDGVRTLHPLSGDIEAARQAIFSTDARGSTALYNGLYLTLNELMKERRTHDEVRRGAIAVLSDGDDTASLVGYEDVLEVAKEAGIPIYTIQLTTPTPVTDALNGGRALFSESEFAMRTLALETGARAFFPDEVDELAGVYDLIARELATQYSLGYLSNNPVRDGSYRRIVVRVDEANTRARTRAGYVAASLQ